MRSMTIVTVWLVAILVMMLVMMLSVVAWGQDAPGPAPGPVHHVVSPGVEAPAPAPALADLTAGDVAEGAEETIRAYRTGGWLGALAALVALLTGWLRRPSLWRLLDRLPKRARILVPLALGCAAALLAGKAGGVSWLEAACLALLTGPSAVALHQGVARSLLGGQSPESAVAAAPLRAGGSGGGS